MTTQPTLQRLTPDEQELALLLSLAYLGQLTLDQLARLTQCSARTLQRRLTQDVDSLVKRAWVERVDRAAFDDQLGIPNRIMSWWRLTEAGQSQIRTHAQYPANVLGHAAQYPARATPIRTRTQQHDWMVAETVVCLVEAARARTHGLTGVFVRFECKLTPFHSAPWADALVIVHAAPDVQQAHPIPWTRDLPTQGEHFLTFVIELDRATEPLATIGGKAREYAAMVADPRWRAHWAGQFGAWMPLILWVAPDARRCAQIQQVWQERWPQGSWCSTTFAELRANRWQAFDAGTHTGVKLFASSSLPALPDTIPAQPLAPSPPSLPNPALVSAVSPVHAPSVSGGLAPALGADTPYVLTVALTLTGAAGRALQPIKVQLVASTGEVLDETSSMGESIGFRFAVRPSASLCVRLPDVPLELAIAQGSTFVGLTVPLSVVSDQQALVEAAATRHVRLSPLVRATHICAVWRAAQLERLQSVVDRLCDWSLVLGLVIAMLVIALVAVPVGLSLLLQGVFLSLRGITRLACAIGWMGITIYRCGWRTPGQPVLTWLARGLLLLTFGGLLPIAAWSGYTSWPHTTHCVYVQPGEFISVWQAPQLQAHQIIVRPTTDVRCFNHTVVVAGQEWQHLQVDGVDAWAPAWWITHLQATSSPKRQTGP